MNTLTWFAIALCISQSAMFSGLNLAFFSVSRLRLEIETAAGNRGAARVLAMRKDGNFLLTTILWGNVAANVLLALLSDSVLTGVAAFLFSTVLITFVGEIIPQAYFSRNSLKVAARLAPLLRLYQYALYPVAKPAAWILDRWLGAEAIVYFEEQGLRELLQMHVDSPTSEIGEVEGKGAMNFLRLDDLPVGGEGEPMAPSSIIHVPRDRDRPRFPPISATADDPFLQTVQRSQHKWVILVDADGSPHTALDADGFLRAALLSPTTFSPHAYCHHPVVVDDATLPLGALVPQLQVAGKHTGNDIVDNDLILLWGRQPRIITGADILGRLLRGIAAPPS